LDLPSPSIAYEAGKYQIEKRGLRSQSHACMDNISNEDFSIIDDQMKLPVVPSSDDAEQSRAEQ
jgi:hypothetical protein